MQAWFTKDLQPTEHRGRLVRCECHIRREKRIKRMAAGDSADAQVIKINRGYGRSLSQITVKFRGDGSGRYWEKDFTCDAAAVDRLSIGDSIRIEQLRLVGWQIDPDEHLASGLTPDVGCLRKG